MTKSMKTPLPVSNGLAPMWGEPATPENEPETVVYWEATAGEIVEAVAFDAPEPLESAVEMVADRCFTEAENLGWHRSYDRLTADVRVASGMTSKLAPVRTEEDLKAWIISKMFLVMGEVAEAGEELRNGRDVKDVYYSYENSDGSVDVFDEQVFVEGIPQYKPEGWLVEMADTLIRVCDLVGVAAGQEGVMFGPIVAAKLQYNATRGVMHGGKKF